MATPTTGPIATPSAAPTQTDILAARDMMLFLKESTAALDATIKDAPMALAKSAAGLKRTEMTPERAVKLVEEAVAADQTRRKQCEALDRIAKSLRALLESHWATAPETTKSVIQTQIAELDAKLKTSTSGVDDLRRQIDEWKEEIATHMPGYAKPAK